jgi:hypothetical protein
MTLDELQSDNLEDITTELASLQDSLSCAESCETRSDYIANLRELLESAKTLVNHVNNAIAVANDNEE